MLPVKVLAAIWYGVRDDVPRIESWGIPKFWATDPYRWGSVMGPEESDKDGSMVQPFTRGAIRWRPGSGAEPA
jgi:hypothetical protein